MKFKQRTFWQPKSKALTLVEVLAAMAILGSLLTGIVLAQGKLSIQSRRTMQTREACQLAEGLLSLWWEDEVIIPRNSSGEIGEPAGWRWQTFVYYSDQADDLGAEVMRLNLFGPGTHENKPTLSIEVLVPQLETEEGEIDDENFKDEDSLDLDNLKESERQKNAPQEGPDIN